jgi:FkbM family methyltransferase
MEKIKNEYINIETNQLNQTKFGDLVILPVLNRDDQFSIVFKSNTNYFDGKLKLEVKINGVQFKIYDINENLFYVVLKKEFVFIEINLINNNDNILKIQECIGTLNNILNNGFLEILKPRISVYCLCWNEEKILPHFLNHYAKFSHKITIFDNESTDNSLNIINWFDKCKINVITYNSNNTLNDFLYLDIKNNCWKNDPSEYVIVCDLDEFLYTEDIFDYLYQNSEYDVFTPTGYDMVSTTFPAYNIPITQQIIKGFFNIDFCKSILFKPNRLLNINYLPGAHTSNPVGNNITIKNGDDNLKLLHYKRLSLDYMVNRIESLRNRMSDINFRTGSGLHYNQSSETIKNDFNDALSKSNIIIKNIGKKIFIDGGARIGESLDLLLNKRDDLLGCDVYLFECNPNHLKVLHKISENNLNYNFIVRNEAIWDENSFLDFYTAIDKWGDEGNTLISDKKENLDRDNPIKVKTIKFSDFISQFDIDDYIVLKLDIEGAEYNVLWDLINTNEIIKINELHVEFHDHFFDNMNSIELKNILNTKIKYVNYNWV